MQESIKRGLDALNTRWNAFSLRQKVQIISIVIVLLIALGLTIALTTKPNTKMLVDDSNPKTIYLLKDELSKSNIKSKIERGETALSVSEKDYEAAKSILIQSDITDDSFTFADSLDATSMGTTSEQRKHIQVFEAENRMERHLATLQGIEKAEVKLSIPSDTNFYIESKQKASASVILKLTRELSDEQINGVVQFVKTSVKGLDKENITILDDKSNILYSGEENSGSIASSQLKIELKRKSELEKDIKQLFGLQFEDVKVTVNPKFNWATETSIQEKYQTPDPESSKGIPIKEDTSSSSYKGGVNGEEPGTGTNGGDITQYPNGNPNGSEAKTDEKKVDYALDKQIITTEKQSGELIAQDSSAAIVVSNYVIYDQAELEKAGELDNITWTQYQQQIKSQLVPLTIDDAIINNIAKATGFPPENISVIGYALPKFIHKPIVKKPIDQYVALTILVALLGLLAFALIRKTAPAEITEITPEVSITGVLDRVGDKINEYVPPIDYDSESEIKKQIEQFVDQRPEAVAQLLRNWLSSDWE